MTGLAVIEYAFHLTLIACGAYLAWVVGTSLHQGHIVAPEAAS